MKKFNLLLTFAVLMLMMGISKAATINVNVGNFYFDPVSFDVAVGDEIVWTLVEGTHTTTSTSVPAGAATWNYTFTGVGDTYTYTVTVPGVYEYQCNFHSSIMKGSFSTSVGLPFVEDFDFPANDNITLHGWVAHSAGGTNPITVNDGGLTFPGYGSSGVGNAALLFGNSEDDHRLFDSQTSGSVYAAFMVKVNDNPNGYFIHFSENPYAFNYRGRVYVEGTNPTLEFGLAFSTEAATVTANSYALGTTYLVVLKYTVNAGTDDDAVSLFVFDGTFPNTEPATPTIGPLTNSAATDIVPGAISFRKFSTSQDQVVDGIRIGTMWSDVLPVELTSFTANVANNSVQLNWSTASEVNNSGFQVQRKSPGTTSWQNIAFVRGAGNSSNSNSYSYTDGNLTAGSYSYRLKQVDFDGSSKYSDVVNAQVAAPTKFELFQNYPNPFNPSTKIKFSIPQSNNVKLTVFNLLGQEVKTLFNGYMEAGLHTVNFDAKNLNSGLYFYKLETGNFTQVKKMTLLK